MNARIAKVFIGIEDPYLVFTLPRNAEAVKKVDNTLAELDENELTHGRGRVPGRAS